MNLANCIDSDNPGLEIMKRALELSGYNVLVASNGAETVGVAQTMEDHFGSG